MANFILGVIPPMAMMGFGDFKSTSSLLRVPVFAPNHQVNVEPVNSSEPFD